MIPWDATLSPICLSQRDRQKADALARSSWSRSRLISTPTEPRADVELLDADGDAEHARVAQNLIGNVLRELLDQADMASPDHKPDGIRDRVVRKHLAHIAGLQIGAAYIRLDIEAHPLFECLLMRISANPGVDNEIADEDLVGSLAFTARPYSHARLEAANRHFRHRCHATPVPG